MLTESLRYLQHRSCRVAVISRHYNYPPAGGPGDSVMHKWVCPKCGSHNEPEKDACDWCKASLSGDTDEQVPKEADVPATADESRVVVTDFDMPFDSMVKFIVK